VRGGRSPAWDATLRAAFRVPFPRDTQGLLSVRDPANLDDLHPAIADVDFRRDLGGTQGGRPKARFVTDSSDRSARAREPRAGEPASPFPEGWDPGRDLAVLVGAGAGPLAELLIEGGQRSLIVHGQGDQELPVGARATGSPAELMSAVLDLPGPLPKHVIVKGTHDPWADEERRRGVARMVADALRSKRLQSRTVDLFGEEWVMHGLANLGAVSRVPSIADMAGAFQGLPCVIVSPGPSLSRNLARIPALAGRCVLMTGTHSVAALRGVGVAPHFLFAADSGDLARHYEDDDLRRIQAMVCAVTSRRENFDGAAPRVLSFAGNGPIDSWVFEALGEDAALSTGGSVACSQLSFAVHLGCDPIVFVGQDLSFPEGRFYAEESVDGDARVEPAGDGGFFLRKPPGSEGPGAALADGGKRFTGDQQLLHVPGYHGGTVPTSQAFHTFLVWFETVADSLRGRRTLINATEGGAFIQGMEHRPLAEATESWGPLPEPVGEVLDRRLSAFDAGARRALLAQRVEQMLAALGPCAELARRCRALAHLALDNPRRREELGELESRLTAALRPIRFLSIMAQEDIGAAQEQARRARGLEENLAAARKLFGVVESACGRLQGPLENALRELTPRG